MKYIVGFPEEEIRGKKVILLSSNDKKGGLFAGVLAGLLMVIGGTGLLVVALIPMVLMGWMSVPWAIASFFGGTSLLIIVGVALDTLRIMESHLLVRKYEGFLSHGSLKGRGGM